MCVLKVIKADKIEAAMALKEGQSIMELDHPNVVAHHEQFMSGNLELCSVMEYASSKLHLSVKLEIGGDLASEIERYRTDGMTEDHAMHNFTQICLGLVAVHARGLTHKDLKPENIYFDCFGRLKIGGLVRVTTKKTKVPAPLLNYLAPEVHQGLAVS